MSRFENRPRPSRRRPFFLLLPLLLSLATGACNSSTDNSGDPACQEETDVVGLPTAPDNERVDLELPTFTNPTNVTNPLFPIGNLRSAVLLGLEDGETFRSETTLLAEPVTILWNGEQEIEALESQYVAYVDGRLHEVALDWYAQASDGSVWYLGEDVFNYENGRLADTEGTWLACEDGPAAMIMPASPQVGDVYRPENAFDVVFEEVKVLSIGQTVNGPHGPVAGAILTRELHMDGTTEEKTFAPGYGEFSTGSGANVEALAVAVPADALPGAPPAPLVTLLDGALSLFNSAGAGDWPAASTTAGAMASAWTAYAAGGVPPLLQAQMDDAMQSISEEVTAQNALETRDATVDVAIATLDFHLRHRAQTEIDRDRFDWWVRQLLVDQEAGDGASVAGDAITLRWIIDRFAHTLPPGAERTIREELDGLAASSRVGRSAADVREAASRLLAAIAD